MQYIQRFYDLICYNLYLLLFLFILHRCATMGFSMNISVLCEIIFYNQHIQINPLPMQINPHAD